MELYLRRSDQLWWGAGRGVGMGGVMLGDPLEDFTAGQAVV